MSVEFRVLGPLEALFDAEPVAVPAGRCRVPLAKLLLRANLFASVNELVERLRMANRQIAACVPLAGYRAEIGQDELDLLCGPASKHWRWLA
ncbi:hypothetical protein [Lentzea flava]|uniref:Uncharacterized protein n=1 Tax=Lentzea flava TaxID=103732 RepID=A0ABQ2V206_9PSEU|nr:hypothetical protein [Lentzea flava]MCP2202810.1 hypothetical protein [Lentzea flava]GGU63414.1 hypothetical protein GCM10010178_64300 [Lentzea flava]